MARLSLEITVEVDESHMNFLDDIEEYLGEEVDAQYLLQKNIEQNLDVEPLIYQARQQAKQQFEEAQKQQAVEQSLSNADIEIEE